MGGIKYHTGCNQRVPEYHAWVCLCGGLGAKSYVELGCGSAHFLHDVGVDRIVTVDILPNGLGGGSTMHLQADSHDPFTPARVMELLGEAPDIVFIDADHSAEATRLDFELWYSLAQLAVGFHDILMPGTGDFWRDISRRYPSIQIVSRDVASANAWQHGSNSSGDVDCGGIGVIFK